MKAQISHIVIISTLCLFVFSSCKYDVDNTFSIDPLSDQKIFIIAKGTSSKAGEIGRSFNLKHENISHVGIGIKTNNQLNIYHVIDTEDLENALRKESLDHFLDLDSRKTYYYSIWESRHPISLDIDSIVRKNWTLPIKYDFNFDLKTTNQLYCSEFCASILNACEQLNYEPSQKILDTPYNHLLDRDTFSYYPADFFIGSNQFNIIHESHIDLK